MERGDRAKKLGLEAGDRSWAGGKRPRHKIEHPRPE
jgi:hypothetical protein